MAGLLPIKRYFGPIRRARTAARLVNLDDRIKRWETKRRRAETALAKLSRQRRRLERRRPHDERVAIFVRFTVRVGIIPNEPGTSRNTVKPILLFTT
jgi:hypothetical protein